MKSSDFLLPIGEHTWNSSDPVIVSIIVATYNHEKFIEQAIQGILNQKTSFRVEILINDDASTDETPLIVKQYEERYPHLFRNTYQNENQFSKGLKPWFHILFPRARGAYIAICEGDDYWTDPLKLKKQVLFLESNPEYVFCSHYVDRVDENNGIIRRAEVSAQNLYFNKQDIFHFIFPTLSIVFRNIQLSYPPPTLKGYNGDAVLTGLLSLHGKAAHLNFCGAAYRVHNGGVFSSKSYIENAFKSIRTREIMLTLDELLEWQKSEIIKNLKKRRMSLIRHALKKFDFDAVRKAMRLKWN